MVFSALNAFGGGYYGMAGAESVPTEWFEGSPFDGYFVPGLILCRGRRKPPRRGDRLIREFPMARAAAVGVVAILFGWLAIETLVIGYVSWMQPATAAGGIAILYLAWRLPRMSRHRRHTHDAE